MDGCIIYAAYDMKPRQYYMQDGTYKEYVKFFENELDCAKYCVKHEYKYDSIYIEPDSGKIRQEHYERFKNLF